MESHVVRLMSLGSTQSFQENKIVLIHGQSNTVLILRNDFIKAIGNIYACEHPDI